ncbi:hypothetical protein [Pedobacter steynii]|uniref:Uncharacterized protein n=1 Tax=Pedobacter steynii TaxID=430522 RepID=A0A1D7QJP4_9SPHI|nr:hypothetical protein [Pedobacter steynii]AOM78863.1 hypothetical protein BFS30_17820 [Pedobacter steynii]
MERNNLDYKNIPGWGMDADPENEPTYPMKNYTGDDHNRINYEHADQQPVDVEVLMSNERPAMPRVFGTSVPPSGLSGAIRRYAFKHSEDRYRHWIPLILADRVNMVEGLIEDISRGYLPNIAAERGWKVEWKYNPKGIATKLAAVAAVGLIVFLNYKSKKK